MKIIKMGIIIIEIIIIMEIIIMEIITMTIIHFHYVDAFICSVAQTLYDKLSQNYGAGVGGLIRGSIAGL